MVVAVIGHEVGADRRELLPAESEDLDIGLCGAQRPHERSGIGVARGFTARNHHASHGREDIKPAARRGSTSPGPSPRKRVPMPHR